MIPSEQMFSELNWHPFPKRVNYHTHVMMYKVLNNMAPEYLRDIFHRFPKHTADPHAQLTKSCYPFRFVIRHIMRNLLLLLGLGNGIPCHYI